MALLTVKEVQAIPDFLHGDGIFLSTMFEDELLEEQEGAFVGDFLSDLNEGLPGILCSESRAVWTLRVLYEELDLKDLFEDRCGQDLPSTVA